MERRLRLFKYLNISYKNNMDIENELEQTKEIEKEIVTEKSQNVFLETALGKTIDMGIDMGLRWVLPDLIEDEIINIKNSLIKGGLKEGIDTAVNTAINMGKSVVGIVTGNFENISQAQSAIKKGGILDNVSDLIDVLLGKTSKMGLINDNIATLIKNGKNVILENVSKNIESTFTNQVDNIEKLSKYQNNWKEYYKEENFEGMEKEYKKIKERLKIYIY